jgi:plasmid maintenance system antidote protein VapI
VGDIRVQQAREHDRAAHQARQVAASHQATRDALIRNLYAEGGWSYAQLARALGLTPELIAKIIRPQRR